MSLQFSNNGGSETSRNLSKDTLRKGFWVCCQWYLTSLLLLKFTPLNLDSDGFGQLWDKVHVDEERENHTGFFPLSFPTKTHPSPLPLHSSKKGGHMWSHKWGTSSRSSSHPDPRNLAAVLWCALINEICWEWSCHLQQKNLEALRVATVAVHLWVCRRYLHGGFLLYQSQENQGGHVAWPRKTPSLVCYLQ